MTGRGVRGARALLLAAAVAATAVGCSDEDGGGASDAASKAASAASSLASKGSDLVASATAAAQEKLAGFKDGVNAKGDVRLGDVSKDADGRSTAKFTVTNGSDSAQSYAVQINFRDKGDKLVETVVVSSTTSSPARRRTPRPAVTAHSTETSPPRSARRCATDTGPGALIPSQGLFPRCRSVPGR
ncbi:hypothetical protein [Streptomyces finlayi]|uniref:hypothetical protein n=1 Tax=Streptomyces finlayi TaxID=67296 RepID=UPI0021566968|nr:hypothetical protein [Streptomyces finlayi]